MTRVRATFWLLVVVAIVATGALSKALEARPGPAAGVVVAIAGSVLAVSAFLALRILLVLGRRRARSVARRKRVP